MSERKRYTFIDFYEVKPPFQSAGIAEEDGKLTYIAVEPVLTDDEKRELEEIKRFLLFREEKVPTEELKDRKKREEYLIRSVREVVKKRKLKAAEGAIDKITYYVIRDLLGYGKVDVLMNDEKIEDVSCDGLNVPVYVWHRDYESLPTNVVFRDGRELRNFIYKLATLSGKHISISDPIVEGRLPEGHRVSATLGEVALRGDSFTIRKYTFVPLSIIDLIRLGTITPEFAAYLWILVENKRSIIVCGEVGSGKTTLANALLSFIRPEQKIITIEETPEIRLIHDHWVPLVTRESWRTGVRSLTLFELVKASLRERPDYIIVGEVRGEETYTLFQAIAVGHGGITTLHAGSIEAAINRLTSEPMNIPREYMKHISAWIHIVRKREEAKVVRRVVRVSETERATRTDVILRDVFRYDPAERKLVMVNDSLVFDEIAGLTLLTPQEIREEFKRRKLLLGAISRRPMGWKEFVGIVRRYYREGMDQLIAELGGELS